MSEIREINPTALPGGEFEFVFPNLPGDGSINIVFPEQPANPPAQSGGSCCTPSQPGNAQRCPAGYTLRTVQNNQTFSDLLIENNVSFNALRTANPNLPTTRLSPGTRYCAPPSGTRRMCAYGSRSYVMGQGENLYTLTRTLGVAAVRLLELNPQLAPSDFLPGRVICVP